jgi:hypothetical protein
MATEPRQGAGLKAAEPRWMIAADALRRIATDAGVRGVLDAATTLVIVHRALSEAPSGWTGHPGRRLHQLGLAGRRPPISA